MNLRNTILVTIAGMLVLAAAGCSRGPSHSGLLEAERIIDDYPDSAYTIITAIDTARLRSQADRSLYALLLTQALDKKHLDITTVTALEQATAYFNASDQTRRAMLANYYLGKQQAEQGYSTLAISSLTRAEMMAKSLEDNLYLGLIQRNLYYRFHYSYNTAEALRYAKLSYEAFERTGRIPYIKYALSDLAKAYFNVDDSIQAEKIISSSDVLNFASEDPWYQYSLMNLKLAILRRTQRYEHAYRLADTISSSPFFEPTTDFYSKLIPISLKKGHLADAERYLAICDSLLGDNNDSIIHYDMLSRILKAKNRLPEALEAYIRYDHFQDSVIRESFRNSSLSIQRDFYLNLSEYETLRAEKSRLFAIGGIIILVLIIAVLVLLWRLSVKRREDQYRSLIIDMQSLRQENEQIRSEKNLSERKLRQRIMEAFGSQFKLLDSACNTYFQSPQASLGPSMVAEVEKAIAALRSPDSVAQLQSLLNDSRDNIIGRLRSEFPLMKEKDVAFLTYVFAGYSCRAVCLFCDIKYNYYYTKLARFRQLFASKDTPDSRFLLDALTGCRTKDITN